MDIFTQKKLLMRIIILLTVLNLTLIGFFLWRDFYHRPPPIENPKNPRDITAILKRELNLTKSQVEQIKNLRSVFFEKEKRLSEVIKNERDSINAVMFNEATNEEIIKLLARRIADNEYKMELLRFEQAKAFKSICTPMQLGKFEELLI